MEFDSGSNIFVREMIFQRSGHVIDGHAHNFDHTTYVVRGSVLVDKLRADGSVERSVEVAAGSRCWILIRAGVRHRLTATEDNTVAHCIYAHRDAQGDVVQRHDGWERSYG